MQTFKRTKKKVKGENTKFPKGKVKTENTKFPKLTQQMAKNMTTFLNHLSDSYKEERDVLLSQSDYQAAAWTDIKSSLCGEVVADLLAMSAWDKPAAKTRNK